MYGQVAIQATMPQEDPIVVGSLWVDTSATATIKVCTSVSPYTFATVTGGTSNHDLLDGSVNQDTAAGTVARGDLITGQGVSPKWTRLAKGTGNQVLQSDGTDVVWGAIPGHHTSHENGGADEISVAGLSGLLADGQTPLAHATSHKSGGTDAIKLDELAAPTDVTTLNATSSAHGLLPKLSGSANDVFKGDGTFGGIRPTPQRTSATGTQNDFSLSAHYTWLICDGAAPVFTGFTIGGSTP